MEFCSFANNPNEYLQVRKLQSRTTNLCFHTDTTRQIKIPLRRSRIGETWAHKQRLPNCKITTEHISIGSNDGPQIQSTYMAPLDKVMKKKAASQAFDYEDTTTRARTNEEPWTYLQIARNREARSSERAGDHEAPDLIEARGGRAALRSIPDDDDDALA